MALTKISKLFIKIVADYACAAGIAHFVALKTR